MAVYKHSSTLTAPAHQPLHLWFEPWAEGCVVPQGVTVELRATSPVDGALEIDVLEDRTAVYGWPGSTLQIVIAGEVVHTSAFAVPITDSRLSTKELVTMLFGPPPKPDGDL